MMTWTEAAACGAAGGLIAEAVVTFGRLRAWQQARHVARAAGEALPPLGVFLDPPADGLAALFRILLGGMAGWLLHTEVSGTYAAVAVGASAPALLAQLGRSATADHALRQAPGGPVPVVPPSRPEPGPGSPAVPPVPEEAAQ
ncbi:hypothetical protein K353_06608 [Kitasatospora sp. SolWspMP-SS2h]|uniref:hypothetical protein n=1 Tax=Kitasatospora sp. SolWspMP-SS2h TaxID=1305729 RepID=UPI000DB9A7E5|nr:hypothetical protein [Kitasatospora sp. SolWspMP-SS2h]RAJ29653.1 hypothetical protein K353_06608 [Kitasatospora sp. SolWspMP-SS2h]